MKIIHILSLLLLAGFCGSLQAQQFNRQHVKISYDKGTTAGNKKNFTYKNLRLYPIRASKTFLKDSKNIGKYTPLKVALKTKKVVITEQSAPSNVTTNPNTNNVRGSVDTTTQRSSNTVSTRVRRLHRVDTAQVRQARRQHRQHQVQRRNVYLPQNIQNRRGGSSASVNNLYIENKSQDTLYIMAGEIVQGGKQDRVIAQDMVIPPNSGKINLSVFCVEKGRWSYKKSKNKDNFDGYYGVSSIALRKVVDTEQKQQKVWKEVERSNAKNAVKSGTSAYTEQKKNAKFKKEYLAYTHFFKNKFKGKSNVIGVIVATGDRVVGCDMFASPHLFQSQYQNLLGSYINEAVTDGAPVQIAEAKVEKYMSDLLDKELKNETELKKKGKVFKHNRKKLHVSKY
ncbi:ARPP-1 family domain-containing protein [Microscilla marina]|uniref:ARG and Rhodanese-Phosphatase-superfamily-associated domain-containing protein n=1 Tax=Microscilla marina ATCC 23134 TaxID=313606 RepID=A1ZDG9_MICM2|nr:DUF6569 family protein [Microscilla marina]EAY31707.1 hypothetical protein M23134_05213 [Microscilla marina ATCC 23134]